MSSAEISVRPTFLPAQDEWVRIQELAEKINTTEFVPAGLRGRPEAVIAALIAGREIGVGPMQSLQHISVIDGKVNYSAELLMAKIRQGGHSLTVEYGQDSVRVSGKRADTGDEHSVVWNMQMAAKAGLAGKRNWQQYQRTMLTWRAVTELSRVLFADLTMGLLSYTAEELGDENVVLPEIPESEIVDGEVTDEEAVEAIEETVVLEPEQAYPSVAAVEAEVKPKRKRRTKAEMAADAAKDETAIDLGPEPEVEPEPEPVLEPQTTDEEPHHQAVREQLAKMAGFREWNLANVLKSASNSLGREINTIADLTEEECERIVAVAQKFLAEKEKLAQESL